MNHKIFLTYKITRSLRSLQTGKKLQVIFSHPVNLYRNLTFSVLVIHQRWVHSGHATPFFDKLSYDFFALVQNTGIKHVG